MIPEDKNVPSVPPSLRVWNFVFDVLEKPIIWLRESIVLPNRQKYYYYHEKIRRVPTIDECYERDYVCRYEAEHQYQLDKKVDSHILEILKKRVERCAYEYPNDLYLCSDLQTTHKNAVTNYFIKYGDLGIYSRAFECYMKQKHRMAWERRHGPVGSGKRKPEEVVSHKKEDDTHCVG